MKLLAYWRAIRGYCPACNSDAPALDACKVCHSWRGSFPPPNWLAAAWLYQFFKSEQGVR